MTVEPPMFRTFGHETVEVVHAEGTADEKRFSVEAHVQPDSGFVSVDAPIYEGDIVCKNKNYVRLVRYNEQYGAYVTLCKSQCSNYSIDYLAKGDNLCRNLEVLGNMWQNPELLKRHCYTEYSLEEVYND